MTELTATHERRDIPEPEIAGLRIVGEVDLDMLSSLPANADLHDPAYRELRTRLTQGMSVPDIAIDVIKTPFGEEQLDPFGAGKINRIVGGHSSGKAHKDSGFKVVRLVSDVEPTVFYPTTEDGEPDFSNPFLPEPGVIVEIDDQVWHSPPYSATSTGTRTQVLVRDDVQ